MPSEEMDMTVDFGQAGFGEDIDIDLDFPVGQPDEDMDLGDFERVHDIHNFNSDTRDELMAEGDDLSYGMIDAIEIDHNASAAAANDIDIELEQAVEGIWQQDPPHSAGLHPDTEIDYLDETTAENMDAEKNDIETSQWLPAEETHDAYATDDANGVTVEISTGAQEAHKELLLRDPTPSHENASEPIKTSHTKAKATDSPVASGLKESLGASDIDGLLGDEKIELVSQIPDQPLITGQDEHGVSQLNPDGDIKLGSPKVELQESDEQQETSHFGEAGPTGSDRGDESLLSHDLKQLEHPEVTEPSTLKEDHTNASQPEEAYESADDASEYQLGGESYIDTTNDHIAANDNAPQADSSALGRSGSETSPIRDLESQGNEEATAPGMGTPALGVSGRDDPIELADHYAVYISYGETDYRLFAKSEDDDPNQYFLTDKSALDTPLTQFLTSLREVISEEISPLDDLVMEIDGLGLEFSESTTPDFLEKFTFGDLVVLYDKLVKNEQAESSPPIYTYLTVKPNCNRRMMALGESANAGRGLSEVALYRDSSSVDEERLDDVRSHDTDFSTGDYNDGESESIYPQEDYEEGDSLNSGEQQNSPRVIAEVQLEHVSNQDDEIDRHDNENEDNSVHGSADAADHEQHASISHQGICPFIFHYTFPCTQDGTCLCDDCYEIELQHLATPTRAVVWPPLGIVMPTHNNFPHMTLMTNRIMTEDHATSESSALHLQEASEHRQQPNLEISEAGQLKLQAPKTTATNSSTDVLNSENTSVTATLDGEEHDEIDYNSDDDNQSIHDGIDESKTQRKSSVTTDMNVIVDDEITWESDDDETKNEIKGGSPIDTVQVSPVSGKRSRPDSDASDDAGDKNDYKRLRA
ncbi:hypothetical protein E0Z10_g10003 [Xylaria hypoxylon]|uniref:Uncharacterized protein n=1 Tax=Xylaria hypoxylon TaxID=37992 RepID=A0A4Z0Y764_9PEZI|nr:hypothetical protein E0Z10_g10003 [Xylaria hypoxylon]